MAGGSSHLFPRRRSPATSVRWTGSSSRLVRGAVVDIGAELSTRCRAIYSGGFFMRTHLFRGVVALAVLLTVSAVPALAQSVVRGKVVDAQGKPVPDATVLFEATDANRKVQTKTDKGGEILQVGLASGALKVTVTEE